MQAIRAARMGELKVRGKRKRQEEEEADLGFFKLTEPSPEWDIVEEIEGHAFVSLCLQLPERLCYAARCQHSRAALSIRAKYTGAYRAPCSKSHMLWHSRQQHRSC